MQLSPEHSLSLSEPRIANACVGMDYSALNRYLSDVWFSRVGSFARLAEWNGEVPVSLSMGKGSNS
jgi:hypothetical protein